MLTLYSTAKKLPAPLGVWLDCWRLGSASAQGLAAAAAPYLDPTRARRVWLRDLARATDVLLRSSPFLTSMRTGLAVMSAPAALAPSRGRRR